MKGLKKLLNGLEMHRTYKDKVGNRCRKFVSHGSGLFKKSDFKKLGKNVVLESGVKVFHPENVEIGNNVYVGHGAFLKGYYKNMLVIGDNVWIGQGAFLHGGGGIIVEEGVGIGPFVKILTLSHIEKDRNEPVLYSEQKYSKVVIEYGVDLGIGSIILPGIRIGKNSIVGAGAVVTKNLPAYCVAAGVPAKIIRKR